MHRHKRRIRNHTASNLPWGPDIDQVDGVARGHSQLQGCRVDFFDHT